MSVPFFARASVASPRATFGAWALAALLAVNLAWTTLCLGGYRPETLVVTSALTGALVTVAALTRAAAKRSPPLHPAGWLFLPFLAYATLNVCYVTPVRWLGWFDWFGWAQMIAIFWVVLNDVRAPAVRRALFGALVAIGIVAVVLACYQRVGRADWMMLGRTQSREFLGRSSGPFGIPNSLAALLILFLPALGALALRRGASRAARIGWGALAAFFALGLVLTISRGAWLGLGCALVLWPLVARRWNWRRRVVFAAGALGALVVTGAVLYAMVPAVQERIRVFIRDSGERTRPIMWHAAWAMAREHPVVGTGAGSYNTFFEKYRPEGFHDEPQWAHCDYLNTLSDYGAVGFVLFFGACGWIVWRCARGPANPLRPDPGDGVGGDDFELPASALAIGLLAFAFHLGVDFHLKIPALAMTVATLAALLVQQTWPAAAVLSPASRIASSPSPAARSASFPARSLPRVAWGGLAIASILFTALVLIPRYRAEGLRYAAHQEIDRIVLKDLGAAGYRAVLPAARADLAQAVALDPVNAQAWADVAYAASLWPQTEPTRLDDPAWTASPGREAIAAADRALALTRDVPEFWVRRGVGLDMAGRWIEGSACFSRATTLAPRNAVMWYYQAYHLSLRPGMHDLAVSSVALSLRLDPYNPWAIALRQHLAIRRQAP